MPKSLYQKFLPFRKKRRTCQKLSPTKQLRKSYLAVGIAVLLSTLFSFRTPTPPVSAASCDDIQFIFARGSGESDWGTSYQVWQKEIDLRMHDVPLQYSHYDLGAAPDVDAKYQAVPVTDSFLGFVNLIGAAVSSGEAFAFGDSVESGVEELDLHIKHVAQTCPNTKFVLGGFSQGAMVVSKSLSQLDADKILYAATFGDPKLYLPEGEPNGFIFNTAPDACSGINLSNYRVYVPDCYAYEGALGSYRPYQPEGYWNKLGTWCNGKDIMCSSGMSIGDHVDYVNGNFYEDAAKMIKYRIDETFFDYQPPTRPTPGDTEEEQPNVHDVLFMFDITGSMQSFINTYKSEAKRLIQKVLSAGGRTALYAYSELQEGIYPIQACDFDCNEEQILNKIDSFRAWGGGDRKEGLLSALNIALRTVDWREGATKSVVVLTDNGFHDPDRDGSTLQDIVQLSLSIDPVNIYVISKGTDKEYAELTRLTNGEYFDIYEELEYSTDRIFERPVALLDQSQYYGVAGDTISFDASKSYGFTHGDLTFDWDLDGDGAFEILNDSSKISQTYASTFDDYVQVRVSDASGSSTMSAKVKISPQPTAPTTISDLNIAKTQNNSAKVTFSTDAAQVLVVLEDAPIGFITPESGQGDFYVTDLEKSTRLTLVPYSADEYRGKRTVATIDPDSSSQPADDEDTEPTLPTDQGNHNDSGSSATPDTPKHDSTIIGDKVKPTAFSVPKVPNTGTRSF